MCIKLLEWLQRDYGHQANLKTEHGPRKLKVIDKNQNSWIYHSKIINYPKENQFFQKILSMKVNLSQAIKNHLFKVVTNLRYSRVIVCQSYKATKTA